MPKACRVLTEWDLRFSSAPKIIIGQLLGYGTEVRSAIVSDIEFAWLDRFCPHIVETQPPSEMKALYSGSASLYLDRTLGIQQSE